MNGRALDPNSLFPKLEPLPLELLGMVRHQLNHIGRASAYYNKIFSIAATGVDNGKGGGVESIIGHHSLKINGSVYSYLPETKGAGVMSGGLTYFTFDNLGSAIQHGESLNALHPQHNLSVLPENVEILFSMFRRINPFAQELRKVGGIVQPYTNGRPIPTTLRMDINVQTHLLDVGTLLSDDSSGNIVIRYTSEKGNNISSFASFF
jgi:hypothetical protein